MTKGRAPSVLLITDPGWPLSRVERVIEDAGAAIGGALAVQLRQKSASPEELSALARRLRRVTSHVGAGLIVNAPSDVHLTSVIAAGADGAHVPCRTASVARARAVLGTTSWISTPTHTPEDVALAIACGVTAVLVSPIWMSPGKGEPRGPSALHDARSQASKHPDLLVYALGGVDASRAAACADAGADGVAVIRALLDAPEVRTTARELAAAFWRSGGVPGCMASKPLRV
jgi:thiamine-phosphate pyrophosphorylase